MNPEDRKLALLALAVAVGGGYLSKIALDEILGPAPPPLAQQVKAARAQASPLSEAVSAAVSFGASAWMLAQIGDWIYSQVGS